MGRLLGNLHFCTEHWILQSIKVNEIAIEIMPFITDALRDECNISCEIIHFRECHVFAVFAHRKCTKVNTTAKRHYVKIPRKALEDRSIKKYQMHELNTARILNIDNPFTRNVYTAGNIKFVLPQRWHNRNRFVLPSELTLCLAKCRYLQNVITCKLYMSHSE